MGGAAGASPSNVTGRVATKSLLASTGKQAFSRRGGSLIYEDRPAESGSRPLAHALDFDTIGAGHEVVAFP
jgi:hypothetical protein